MSTREERTPLWLLELAPMIGSKLVAASASMPSERLFVRVHVLAGSLDDPHAIAAAVGLVRLFVESDEFSRLPKSARAVFLAPPRALDLVTLLATDDVGGIFTTEAMLLPPSSGAPS